MADKVANARKSPARRAGARTTRDVNSAPMNGAARHDGRASEPLPLLLTVREVGSYFGIGDDVVRHLIRTQKLQGAKVGGQWRVHPTAIAEYVMRTFEKF